MAEQKVQVSPVFDELGNEPHFPSSKSVDNMESILLENSVICDEENTDPPPSTAVSSNQASSTEQGKSEETQLQAKPLAQYFTDQETESGEFFDTLQTLPEKPESNSEQTNDQRDLDEAQITNQTAALSTAEKGNEKRESNTVLEESPVATADEKKPQNVPTSKSVTFADLEDDTTDIERGVKPTRPRTISASQEISVAFEESKGTALPTTPSTKNLSKFFTTTGNKSEAGDADSASFFDSFTVGDGDQGQNKPPLLTHSISQDSQPDSITGSFPPETPPIPGASPFHSHQPSRLPSGDDVFSVSLRASDEERRYDAWIPSQYTQQVLARIANSENYVPEPENITMPGVILDESLGDPVSDLLRRVGGGVASEATNRQTLNIGSVPANEDGLRQLMSAECYRSAIDLTTRLLTEQGQGVKSLNTPSQHSTYTLQLWFTRLSLFVKLRLYAHADSEWHAFGNLDKPDMYYEFYRDTYPGRRGSLVPFEMRMLHAVLPLYMGKTQESLDRLYYMYAITTQILENLNNGLAEDGSIVELTEDSRYSARELWRERELKIIYTKVNCLLHIKDFASALELFDTLLEKDTAHKREILCAIARAHLQIGDTQSSQRLFEQAEKCRGNEIQPDSVQQANSLMNRAFIALGKGDFTEAQQLFKQTTELDPANTVAVNNMAVCAVYNGCLKEALVTLETLINADPARYLQEGILFNLCTLYELESSQAMNKKKKLLNLVSQHKGNGFNVACLKLV